MSQFASPRAPGGGIQWADHLGALMIVEPTSVELDIQTKFGQSDAVKADITVIDGPGAPAEYPSCLIFPKVLRNQTERELNTKLLGRLGQGKGKDGQDPPWVLLEASDDDEKLAETWVAKNRPQFTAPAGGTPPF